MPESSSENLPENGSTQSNVVPPESSDGGEEGGQHSSESMVDRFKAALKPEEEGTSPGSGEAEAGKPQGPRPGQLPQEGQAGEQPEGELTDAELKLLNPKTQRRIKTLLRERNEARGHVEQYKRGHEAYDQLVSYVQRAGLSTEEVNTGFTIMRLMKEDPQQALDMLLPYVQQLQQVAGAVLPAELQQKVQLGEIDENTAYELAQLRARGVILKQQQQRQTQSFEQERRNGVADAVGATVTAWEQRWKSSDPDFATLQPYVQREIELRLRRGEVPQSPAQAEKMCEQVLTQVRQELSRFRPKPQQIRTPTGGAQPTNLPAPKTMLEAMSQAIGR